ncbi:hypothetical protein STRTUCAR8_05085 [Streptomyces turgidiscabies Car8]|uniref:Uncharacterized protein n=1 Tax=Streptomyces turgidiscabies (strain Car8) TaxID=698760 RepID=L7F379_STRT8|nr:hypothetical protein STRTUCAR8_05085 [Streptomyces turgidiscabies Car8]
MTGRVGENGPPGPNTAGAHGHVNRNWESDGMRQYETGSPAAPASALLSRRCRPSRGAGVGVLDGGQGAGLL